MIPHKQLSWANIFEDCQTIFEEDKPQFLTLLEQHIDMNEIIPITFRNHFYASMDRIRKYPLHSLLWTLIIYSYRLASTYFFTLFKTFERLLWF